MGNGSSTQYTWIYDSAMNPMTHIDSVNGLRYNYEYDGYGTITAISAYLPSGASGYVFVGTNSLGDVNALYNANGDLIVRYEYDAWGKVIAETDANGNALTGVAATWSQLNPFRYRGYVYDAETGLYYNNSRYYDAEVGRFISADDADLITSSIETQTDKNLFAYCDNNPIVRADDGGAFWHIVVGAAVSGSLEIISQLSNNGFDFKKLNMAKIAISTVSGGLSAAFGTWAGAAISGFTAVAMDIVDGERSVAKLCTSFASSAVTSLVVGKAVDKVCGSIENNALSKLSKRELKSKVRQVHPEIKGSEINKYKDLSLVKANYPDVANNNVLSTIGNMVGQFVENVVSNFFDWFRGRK